jgi:hypothetical protein
MMQEIKLHGGDTQEERTLHKWKLLNGRELDSVPLNGRN